ncbi:hypothetical protein BVY03_01715 [bacterium K02(2017)]|nr:hypothetical protein BVY03_01715 [bacterium K02(2017)]
MVKRKVFYSFYYRADNWRAAQIRNMGVIEGNKPASDNDWEQVERGGDSAIQSWIDSQLNGKSCTIVLIGQNTARRPWIDYEITQSWNTGKGVLGIHIHHLKDSWGAQSLMGNNPFSHFTMKNNNSLLSEHVKIYDPPTVDSQQAYGYIQTMLSDWIEEAIHIRNNYG